MSCEVPNTTNSTADGCRREFYRLRYPITQRPTLVIGERSFKVTELSERGIRFYDSRLRPEFAQVEMGEHVIQATLVLPTANIGVMGVPARRDRDEVILVEVDGLEFHDILEEQRRLASSFLHSSPDNE